MPQFNDVQLLDYDDITQITKTHPTAVLLPAALAVAEETGASGREMLLGYMAGFEVACGVGEALSEAYYDDLGWHPTGPLGAVGSAAAASRIMALNPEQTAMTISLAASQASGLRQNFGTMTKPFHAGDAARVGVVSAKLVRDGFTASQDALEGTVRVHPGLLRRSWFQQRAGGGKPGEQMLPGGIGHRN